ncbi:hypothetical protein GTP55_01220 [Duganella sp. FT109W]|uniref:DUF1488 family protein n=1 Tax=Duganella margarita TaxID=2692170 RepID=A0ABW9WAA3_9BURK|nr:hypothetical protein [Duganella margarita]MYN37987.1 hypothetical protein [Duganella margarita]
MRIASSDSVWHFSIFIRLDALRMSAVSLSVMNGNGRLRAASFRNLDSDSLRTCVDTIEHASSADQESFRFA